MKMLLDAGAELNTVNSNGSTALHCAAEAGNLRCLELLLQAGATISTRNNEGKTAIALCRIQVFPPLNSALR